MEQDLRSEHTRQDDPALMRSGYPAGVLPPPEVLRQYETMMPGAAERIFRLAEDHGQYRYQLETARLRGETVRAVLALCFSAAISLMLVLGGIAVSILGRSETSGIPFIVFGVGLLVGVFIFINANRRPEPRQAPPAPQQRPARVGRAYDPQGFDL